MAQSHLGFLEGRLGSNSLKIGPYSSKPSAVVYPGSCLDLFSQMKQESVHLVVTSPPYNIGKEYEVKMDLDQYLAQQETVIKECVRLLANDGSICWQVGNFVSNGEIIPLDIALFPIFKGLGMQLRNRIVWHFEHGLHCTRRLSGRYETILWFTKSDTYFFDVDPIRVPQKYPGKKHFKGPKAGMYSSNPLGKNPGDVWIIPNVKSNHIEKTVHPCQFPVELIERLVLALTKPGQIVLDPFLGTGTSIIAAIRHGRVGVGAETVKKYVAISTERIRLEQQGDLKTRPMNKPVYDPIEAGNKLTTNPFDRVDDQQPRLLERRKNKLGDR